MKKTALALCALVLLAGCGEETQGLPPAISPIETAGPSLPLPGTEEPLSDKQRQFLDELAHRGIVYENQKELLNAGKTACGMMNHGGTPAKLAIGEQTLADRPVIPGIANADVPWIAKAASKAFCPRHIEYAIKGGDR